MNINLPLINTHTHAAMVAFRDLTCEIPLKEWLETVIWPAEKNITPKFVFRNTIKAIKEMQKNKIVAFNDMYFFEEQVAKAAQKMKMHVVIGEVILNFPTASAKHPEEALKIAEKQIIKFRNSKYVKVAVAPHSIYATSKKILLKAKELSKKYNTIFHIHLAETEDELKYCLKLHKMTPVEYLDSLGILDSKCILAHCVHVNENDIKILSKTKANISHCPLSNLKLGSGIAPVDKMLKAGLNITLGTDGAASSNRLDLWEAGKFASLIQKGINKDPTALPAKEVLKFMSINGMKALGYKNIAGFSLNNVKKFFKNKYNTKKFYLIYS